MIVKAAEDPIKLRHLPTCKREILIVGLVNHYWLRVSITANILPAEGLQPATRLIVKFEKENGWYQQACFAWAKWWVWNASLGLTLAAKRAAMKKVLSPISDINIREKAPRKPERPRKDLLNATCIAAQSAMCRSSDRPEDCKKNARGVSSFICIFVKATMIYMRHTSQGRWNYSGTTKRGRMSYALFILLQMKCCRPEWTWGFLSCKALQERWPPLRLLSVELQVRSYYKKSCSQTLSFHTCQIHSVPPNPTVLVLIVNTERLLRMLGCMLHSALVKMNWRAHDQLEKYLFSDCHLLPWHVVQADMPMTWHKFKSTGAAHLTSCAPAPPGCGPCKSACETPAELVAATRWSSLSFPAVPMLFSRTST